MAFRLDPKLQVNGLANLPQIKIISDEAYDSLFVRTLIRALRAGFWTSVGVLTIQPGAFQQLASLVFAHDWAGLQVFTLPAIVAFFTAVEKVWRDTSASQK